MGFEFYDPSLKRRICLGMRGLPRLTETFAHSVHIREPKTIPMIASTFSARTWGSAVIVTPSCCGDARGDS